MKQRLLRIGVAIAASVGLCGGALLTVAVQPSAAATTTLFVSPTGSPAHSGTSCATAKYSTISSAVSAAASGDRVAVCAGTYAESVLITKALTLAGAGATKVTVNAAGQRLGIVVVHSHVVVEGFTVENAEGAGVAVLPLGAALGSCGFANGKAACSPVNYVTIRNNVVMHDDKAYVAPAGCPPTVYPGDCGGGVLFDTVAHSTIARNTVAHNVDGLLVTDDFGPTHNNTIVNNTVVDNLNECGITLPSHNPGAASYTQVAGGNYEITGVNPSVGGVYDNYVAYNIANGNGTGGYKNNLAGSGAGILMASAGAGTAVYDNTIAHNEAARNGLAGIVIHAHYTGGEDLQGNKLVDNTIGVNNLKGDALDTPYTGADYSTTGILLFSAMPIGVTVSGNHISNVTDGIWRTPNVSLSTPTANTFTMVAHHNYVDHDPFGSALAATSVTSSSATLVGFAVPNGVRTSAYFQWGQSPVPPNYTATPTIAAGSGTKMVPVVATLSHLMPSTTYVFWLVVTNNYGTTTGVTLSFTTPA